jgi:hypothetical protein
MDEKERQKTVQYPQYIAGLAAAGGALAVGAALGLLFNLILVKLNSKNLHSRLAFTCWTTSH